MSGDVCVKPATELKDVKSCEICTEVPPPQPPAECPLSARTTAEQCDLASLQTMQEAAPQSESLIPEAKEAQQADSQTCPLVCKLPAQEATMPSTQTAESAPIEAKPEIPVSAQDVTQLAAPLSMGSPQDVAITSPVASEAPIEDIAKPITESVAAVTQPLTIDPGEQHAEMLLAASEISTVSPVPIQVAESVLQAEPKESVLGAAVIVSDQAIATTVTAVHESTDVVSASTPMQPVQLNGSACEIERRGDVMTATALVSGLLEKTAAPPEATKESASDLVTRKDVSSEIPPATEEKILTSSSVVPLETSSAEKLAEQVAKTETEQAKPAEQITKTETAEVKPLEQITKVEATEEKTAQEVAKAETIEAVVKQEETAVQAETASTEQLAIAEEAIAKLPSEVPESPISEQSPTEEPIKVKQPDVPSTPTVTEATPPISPSVESAQEMEEAAATKKVLKKSDSAEDGEDKKGAKKTVKKVTKKPKAKAEEAAPSAATEGAAAADSKTKKTVKTTKKTGAKTLETDTSVPETPPPLAGAVGVDTPVPPKRKTKGSNAKGTGKKSEMEE